MIFSAMIFGSNELIPAAHDNDQSLHLERQKYCGDIGISAQGVIHTGSKTGDNSVDMWIKDKMSFMDVLFVHEYT